MAGVAVLGKNGPDLGLEELTRLGSGKQCVNQGRHLMGPLGILYAAIGIRTKLG